MCPADIESSLVTEVAANNIAPSPDGLPPNSSPNIVYTEGREDLAMQKRWWNRVNATITSGGSTNAQTLTFGVAPLLYTRGQRYAFIAGFTNSGATTLNVNGLGAKAVQIAGAALTGGELTAGLISEVIYDGTQFQVISGPGYASVAGGLINGNLQINGGTLAIGGGTTTSVNPTLIFNKPAGAFANAINAYRVNQQRWAVVLGDSSAESGSNTGSNFLVARYNDTGALLDSPLTIARSSGNVTISQAAGGLTLINGAGTSSCILQMNKNTGAFSNAITGMTAGLSRWQIQLGTSSTETGTGNAGSDFALLRYTDAGGFIDTPISTARTNGVTTFSVAIVNGPSDRSLKENITPLDGALDKVKALQGVSFNMKATPEKREIGLIAQDVEPVVPEIVQQFQNSIEGETKLALDYPKLTALLIEAIKALTAKVEALEARLPLAPETA